MIRINPTKILVSGDKLEARKYTAQAKKQMNILLQDMAFQNLKQGIRRVEFGNIKIICKKIFNYQECSIYAPIVGAEEETIRYFIVIFSTGSGKEAVAWDLINDEVLIEKESLSDIQEKLDSEGIEYTVAEYPMSDAHVWTVSYPNDEHDSPVILPNYLHGYYGASIGYEWYATYLYPSSFTYDHLGNTDTISWELDYVNESPLPYPNKTVIATGDPNDEDDEKSSYISTFQGRVDTSSSLTSEFESLTGVTWPGIDVWRYMQFWHPFFWYSIKDEQGSYQRLSSYGRGIQLSDTWADGEWNPDGTLAKSSLTWQSGGIVTNEEESLIFEYVSVCHKFVDTYGSGMCDTDLSTLDEYFRMYEHGKVELSSLKQQILDGANAYRTAEGTHELVFNSVLSEAAQRHARDMATTASGNGVLAIGHTGTDGSTPDDRITDAGYFQWIEKASWGYKIGENVAYTNASDAAASALTLWENSPPHWANMIDEDYSEIGIGVVLSEDGTYVFVQNFGKVDHRYPGFSPFNPENLKAYVDDNFDFDPANEDTRQPEMYLVGSIEITDVQLKRLQR